MKHVCVLCERVCVSVCGTFIHSATLSKITSHMLGSVVSAYHPVRLLELLLLTSVLRYSDYFFFYFIISLSIETNRTILGLALCHVL